jgi:hypothetical protein
VLYTQSHSSHAKGLFGFPPQLAKPCMRRATDILHAVWLITNMRQPQLVSLESSHRSCHTLWQPISTPQAVACHNLPQVRCGSSCPTSKQPLNSGKHYSTLQSKGVFSSPFHPKFFGFWPIILQNGTKHHAKFLAKSYPFFILDFGLKRQKKKGQKAFTHLMKNLAFWIESMKILTFCISSLQSS